MAEHLLELEAEIARSREQLDAMEKRAQFYRDSLMGRRPDVEFDPGLDGAPPTIIEMIEAVLAGSEFGWKAIDIANAISRRFRRVGVDTVRTCLHRMLKQGRVQRREDGLWWCQRDPKKMRRFRMIR